jgi:Fur family ferric uptake transcriptional regulator
MNDPQAIVQALRGAGHRLTPQRLMVLSAVRQLGRHVTVDDIHRRVLETYPYIDIATVYRTVGLLKRLHLLSEVVQGGVSRYEAADAAARHHHVVCEHCGKAVELPPSYLDDLRQQLVSDVGFELHVEHSALSGLCSECRKDRVHSHSGHTHGHGQGHEPSGHTHEGAH